jgi:hypothetical protein
MLNRVDAPDLESVKNLYIEAFNKYDPEGRVPPVFVEFYPYVGINHTIRIRDGKAFVRIAEICRDMPAEAHRGLAYILVSKLMRRRVSEAMQRAYNDFIRSAHIRERANENRRVNGRKVVTSSKGEVYDLNEMFDSLNFWYFGGKLSKPTLTWSAKNTYRILGHHDSTHDTVSISRSLDDKKVPAYVVEYVLFHEMLHIAHPTRHVNGRRYNHTAAFRRDERRFTHYEAAERWIEKSVRHLKRKARQNQAR